MMLTYILNKVDDMRKDREHMLAKDITLLNTYIVDDDDDDEWEEFDDDVYVCELNDDHYCLVCGTNIDHANGLCGICLSVV